MIARTCRVEQLQASLTAQAAKQASLEEQLADAQERLAMDDGNKARFRIEDSAPILSQHVHALHCKVACKQDSSSIQ